MTKCYFCRKENKFFICNSCQKKQIKEKRRIPLTEWQEMKLGFYRHEKDWINNIKNRKIINKKVYLTDNKGNIKREMPTI